MSGILHDRAIQRLLNPPEPNSVINFLHPNKVSKLLRKEKGLHTFSGKSRLTFFKIVMDLSAFLSTFFWLFSQSYSICYCNILITAYSDVFIEY